MNRIEAVRRAVDEILLKIADGGERRSAYIHLYGVAQSCALLALRRGQDVVLAVIVGMLHDIHSYANMDTQDHAQKSATLASDILSKLQIFNTGESTIVCDAIRVHSDKETIHSQFDELLKEADVLQSWL